jgi:signal transduction histidine kinase
VLTFEDNGQGIDELYLQRIFEMYFRANEKSKGNGLGLYIVKKIVDKLRGTVSVKSQFGKGTLITVTLPNQQPEY